MKKSSSEKALQAIKEKMEQQKKDIKKPYNQEGLNEFLLDKDDKRP